MNLAFEIAGVRYHLEAFVAANVTQGDTVELSPEPTNRHDPNAVKVIKDGHHIGYVPKMFTIDVHALLEQSVKTAIVESAWAGGCSIIFK